MNRIYRLVFNAATGLWTAVAENARGRGKSGSAACALLAVLAIINPAAHAANALDATVVGGTGSVATVGNATTINQVSNRLAIDWTQLSTRAGEALNFVQPSAQAIALNRITSSAPSSFLGNLTANGQVFILNPNGVLFSAGSQVTVGGIVASTLNMNPTDFMNGSNTFTKTTGTGIVVNQGTMTAAQGGYLALLAPEVRNEGVMTATLGTALLAAGNKVTLNLNNGSLLSYSIDQGAINALADNKQLIKADGGQVLLSAKALDALTTATVNNTGVIEARTLQNIAGRIMLMGDMEYGTVNVAGTLDASAPNGGNGGFIETSAAKVKVTDSARITTKADAGQNGKWLIDPTDFTIATSGGDMTGAALTAALANGSVEILSTLGAGGVDGDINVKDLVQWGVNTLTLNAQRNINFSSLIIGSGTGKLALKYGQGAVAAGNTASYKLLRNGQVNLAAGQNFSTQLGSNGAVVNYQVITALGAQGSVTGTDLQGINGNMAGNYALGSSIDAAATAGWNGGLGFDPLGGQVNPFTGNFDGLGHTIGTLTINRTTDYVGMFARTAINSTVRNVGLVNASVQSTRSNVGGLIGNQSGLVANSFVSGSVQQGLFASGGGVLTGVLGSDGVIIDSYAAGSMSNGSQMGGLVGISSGKITTSYSSASVNTDSNNVGGLVGYLRRGAEVTNSYATGNVTSSSSSTVINTGGLLGLSEGTVSNSYATGSVSGQGNVGGLIGYVAEGTVSGSFATGSVSGTTVNAGGLIGLVDGAGNLLNAYSTGAVSSNSFVGGLVGRNAGIIINTYATGSVTGSTLFGNLAGQDNGNIVSSYTSANSLRQQSTFTGWNIDAIGGTGKVWRIYEGNTAPLLRSFLTPVVAFGAATLSYNGTTQQGPTVSGVSGNAASGRNAGIYQDTYYSSVPNQSGFDITGSRLTITQASLVLSSSDLTKTYDGDLSALGTAVATDGTQLFAGDSISGGSFAFTDKNFGLGIKAVTSSGITVNDGNSGNNYSVSYASNTTSTINKAPLLVTAAGVDKTYDGNTTASVTYGDNRIGTDVLTFSSSAAFVSKNVANGIGLNVTGIALDGADAINYTANTTANTSARITPKALTITANNDSKDFGGAPYAGGNGVQFNGFAAGESVANLTGALTYGGTAQGAKAAGSYSIAPGGLTASNYAVQFADGTLTIRPPDAVTTALGGPGLTAAYNSALQGTRELKRGSGKETFEASPTRIDGCGMRMPSGFDVSECN